MDDHQLEEINNKRVKIHNNTSANKKKYLLNIRLNAAIQSIHKRKTKKIIKETGLSRYQIKYWKSKLVKRKNMNSWGGDRCSKFTLEQKKLIGEAIQILLDVDDTITAKEIGVSLQELLSIDINECYVRNIINDMKRGWETPDDKEKDGYNITQSEFFSYLEWIQQEDVDKLVFMDELNINNEELKAENNIAITCMVRHDGTIFNSFCKSINDQNDTLEIITQSIEAEYLKKGDILLLDISRIHVDDKKTLPLITHALDLIGATLRFLPTYVTELNPIGMIFGVVKNIIKQHKPTSEHELCLYTYAVFSSIGKDTVQMFFKKATNPLDNKFWEK